MLLGLRLFRLGLMHILPKVFKGDLTPLFQCPLIYLLTRHHTLQWLSSLACSLMLLRCQDFEELSSQDCPWYMWAVVEIKLAVSHLLGRYF